MKKYLLDTNICIFFLRGKQEIFDKLREIGVSNCVVSEITIAELLYGLECCDTKESERLKVENFCNAIRILPIKDILPLFAKEKARLRKEGKLIDDFDLLIGVTAQYHDCILVTDNIKHLGRLPVTIENWIRK